MYQIGDFILGKVTEVKPFALFLSFEDGSIGLLHISEISDSYIKDIEKFGTKGDEMKVKVISIDPKNGFLRVSLKQVPTEQSFNSHKNTYRKAPETDEAGFKIIEEHLQGWIDEALEKINK